MKKVAPKTFLVAFRAEYDVSNKQLVESSYERLKRAHADLIVANDVSRKGAGFRTETNEVFIIDKKKSVTHIPLALKSVVASKIWDVIEEKVIQG